MQLRPVRRVLTVIGVIGAVAVSPVGVVPKHAHAVLQTMVKTIVAVHGKVEIVTLKLVVIPTIGALRKIPVIRGKLPVKESE